VRRLRRAETDKPKEEKIMANEITHTTTTPRPFGAPARLTKEQVLGMYYTPLARPVNPNNCLL
jgi:hypothetical protein